MAKDHIWSCKGTHFTSTYRHWARWQDQKHHSHLIWEIKEGMIYAIQYIIYIYIFLWIKSIIWYNLMIKYCRRRASEHYLSSYSLSPEDISLLRQCNTYRKEWGWYWPNPLKEEKEGKKSQNYSFFFLRTQRCLRWVPHGKTQIHI